MERSRRLVDLALQGLRPSSSSSLSSMRKEYSIVKILQLGLFKIVPSDQVSLTHTEGLCMTKHNGKDSWCIIFKEGGLHEMQTELGILNRFHSLESQYKFMAYPSVETQTDGCSLRDKDVQTDDIPIPVLELPVHLLNPIGELQSIEADGQLCGTYNIVPFSGNDEPTGIDPDGSNQTDVEMEDLEEIVKAGKLALQQETGIDPDGSNQTVIDAEELEVTAGSEINVTAGDVPEVEGLLFKTPGDKNKKNRQQFCIYCKKRIFNLPRHLILVHDDQDLVKEYMRLRDAGDKKMLEIVGQLRRQGNAEFNKLLQEQGLPVEGVRTAKNVSHSLLKSCPNCGAFYKKRTLHRHFKSCSGRPAEKNFTAVVEGKEKIKKANVSLLMSQELREQIIPGMRIGHNDDVVDTIINDQDLISMGNNLVLKFGHELETQKKLIRRRLRAMAHLKVTMAKEDPTIQHVRDIFDTDKWETYLKAVQEIAKLKSNEDDIAPNVVNELGLLATNVARNVKVSLPKTAIGEMWKKTIEDWLSKHEVQFGATIGYQARKLAEKKKWKKRKYEPVAEDITKLNNHLRGTMKKALGVLEVEFEKSQWEELNKACMLLLLIFNRKRVGELENMTVSDFQRKQKVRKDSDVYHTLTESEKMLASNFFHVQIRGKLARGVPILIEEGLANAIDVLVSFRGEAGIPETNDFLFAKSDGHLDGSISLSNAASICGAKVPKSLTSTRLRKHIASVSQALNLTDTDLKTLSGFLGHTTKTHLENYRLPSDAVHAAKLSKLLLALDQGTISKYRGKTMEEIDVSTTVAEVEEEVGMVDNDLEPTQHIRKVSGKKTKKVLVTTPTKKKTLTRHLRPSPSPLKSPITSYSSPKQPQRRKWTPEEVAAMETEFAEFLKDERLPGTTFCNEIRKRCDVLSTRKASLIRAWINNQIVKRNRVQKKQLFTSD